MTLGRFSTSTLVSPANSHSTDWPTLIVHHPGLDKGQTIAAVQNGLDTEVRFEVFTAVTMKNGTFWDVTPRGSCKNRRFGGTYRLHHQGDKNR
jgi:hypothetical protein